MVLAPPSPALSSTSDDDADFADAIADPLNLSDASPTKSASPATTKALSGAGSREPSDVDDYDSPDPPSPTKAAANGKRALSSKAQKRKDAKDKKAAPLAQPRTTTPPAAPTAPVAVTAAAPPAPAPSPAPVAVTTPDEPEPEVTQLHIEHSDDDDDEEEERNRTPTATSPVRASVGPPSPPEPVEPEPFDFSRTSLTETSLSASVRHSVPPSPPATPNAAAADASSPRSTSTAAEHSRQFSLSEVTPPETPSAFTSVTEHLSSSPSTIDVSDGASPSIAASVWRNSVMGNGKASSGLVDINLGDDAIAEEEGEDEGSDAEGAGTESGSVNGSAKANGKRREDQKQEFNFLLQRLESQNSLLEIDPKAQRISTDGNSRIRDSFLKMQKEAQANDTTIDWDFWGAVMSNYEHVASTQPRELSRAIQQGIPPALRGMTWQLMSASKDQDLESTYSALLKQTSSHEKSIGRDLSRTFPKHEYFRDADGPGQENLFNVVKAYSLYDEEVGYTQGLQFIVGPLLLNMPDEEAFCVLVRLMKSYDLRSHYTPNMPGLQLRLFQFDRLVEELLPGVFMHLLRQGVKSSMYASQWFLTLFGYRFPLELVSSVFDLVFAEGVEAIFRFSVAILKRNETKLCELEFEHLLEYLKNGLFEAYAPDFDDPSPEPLYKADEFVREALQVKITPLMLDQFGDEWENLCRQQNAHTAEIENLRRANSQLSSQVRGLESSLSQINIEHCELVRQVVMAKLEREELEDELVKYKIAFADLSHRQEADGAQTSRASQERMGRNSLGHG
ncbi:hypothetical protein RQP46_005439 [Phenoliferia psychrophenolica]